MESTQSGVWNQAEEIHLISDAIRINAIPYNLTVDAIPSLRLG